MPAYAQVELSGSYAPRLYEDYIERGPGSDLGDYTGVPLNDEARARALLYEATIPSMIERQCLALHHGWDCTGRWDFGYTTKSTSPVAWWPGSLAAIT